jgi:heat shock protein HtpX
MASIYTNIDQNKRNTWLFVVGFILFISAIGWLFGEIYAGEGLFFVGLALIISGLSGFFSYYYSDKIVLAISGAREVKPQDNQYLHNLVENMSIASGLPKPRVYVIDSPAMNAFATGRDPQNAVVCFTTGIIQKLEKRELEGVVAHELAHIGNYDIRLMSVVTILAGTITILADWFMRSMFFGSGRRENRGGGGIVLVFGLILMIVSPIIAMVIKLAISRNREYLADSTAALMTRYPQGLSNALRKLAGDQVPLEKATSATAHMYIINPLSSKHDGMFANMFNTHPPITERIRRLENM